jgi:hypothetical protein
VAIPKYRAYLLRVWWTDEGAWRAVLEDPHTGDRLSYAQPATLLLHLTQRDMPAEPTRASDKSSPRTDEEQ